MSAIILKVMVTRERTYTIVIPPLRQAQGRDFRNILTTDY